MLATLVTGFLLMVGLCLLLPVLVLLLQIIVALGRDAPSMRPAGPRPRIAVLIPAHDESSGLLPTLASVMPQLAPGDRCLVVADNCGDDTAAVASNAGAAVVERFDSALRGKGYALDFGMRHLAADPPQVVIVIDADCLVDQGAIDILARASHLTGRPVQALYLMKSPPSAGRSTLIAEFAWCVKNWARPLGFQRLGLPCALMGTGMAFPWAGLQAVNLASGHIAEDMKLGIDLALDGTPPLFCPQALVWSSFPANEIGSRSQRTRWEHGHLSLIVGEMPGLLATGIVSRKPQLVAMAMDLLVPPLALLVMVVTAWTILCAVVSAAFATSIWPLVISLSTLCLLIVAVGVAWIRFGRSILSIGALALAGVYALRKIPLYARFLFNRQAEWVRSKRDGR